jgi:hypothetical protein
MERDRSLDTLNSFLVGEIAAVESYRRALAGLERRDRAGQLRLCLASHQRRVAMLTRRIRELGGTPSGRAGRWGGPTRPEDAGPARGDDAAIAALEAGEDGGLGRYLERVGALDRETRRFVARELLPEQVRTHDSLCSLALALAKGASPLSRALPSLAR